jgi:hypothetical protein
MTQSSALMLLYAAMTFLQHGIGVADAAAAADVAAATVGVDVAAGVEPPHAATSIAVMAARTASLHLMSSLPVF